MFRSRARPIVIPQSEHGRLAGALATLWGNAAFDAPPVDRASLVAGIGLHDRDFGYVDNAPIGEMPDEEWLRLTRYGFFMSWSDQVADLIVKHHMKRLVTWTDTPAHRTLAAEMEAAIRERIDQLGMSRALFERIDRITNLCDSVSFAFCFEQPAAGEVAVHARNGRDETTPVRYTVDGPEIRIAPWPFAGPGCEGYLVGYAAPGYPQELDPVVVPYRVLPGAGGL